MRPRIKTRKIRHVKHTTRLQHWEPTSQGCQLCVRKQWPPKKPTYIHKYTNTQILSTKKTPAKLSLTHTHTHTQERLFNQLLPTPSSLSAPSARGQQTISSSRGKQIAKRGGTNKDGDKHPQIRSTNGQGSQTRNSQDHQG